MKSDRLIWLASYPRSGNTYLRTILWQCFGLRSASIYPNDLKGNKKLEEYVGHIEYGPDKKLVFPGDALPLIKTHELASDSNPAIYVIRDGRAACVSMWIFYNKAYALDRFIEGETRFGSWSAHINFWNPWNRPDTLLLKYEEMVTNLPATLESIGRFLKRKIINDTIIERTSIAEIDGRWVKAQTDWTTMLSGDLLERFNQLNEDVLKKAGYL